MPKPEASARYAKVTRSGIGQWAALEGSWGSWRSWRRLLAIAFKGSFKEARETRRSRRRWGERSEQSEVTGDSWEWSAAALAKILSRASEMGCSL